MATNDYQGEAQAIAKRLGLRILHDVNGNTVGRFELTP